MILLPELALLILEGMQLSVLLGLEALDWLNSKNYLQLAWHCFSNHSQGVQKT
jgi:hypothetical protein